MIGLEHHKPSCLFWRATAAYQGGKGFLQSQQRWYNREIDVQGQIGYSFTLTEVKATLTPYTGLGFFHDNQPIYVGSYFKESYPYIPVGFLASWDICDSWSLGLRSQANIILNRKLKNNQIQYSSENGFSWINELPVTFNLKNKLDVSVAPFFQYNSNISYTTDNTSANWGETQTWGVRVEFGYRTP